MTAHCSCRESKGLTPEERAEVARRNGAKSRGPVTPEGKRRVGRNGLLSRTVVLDSESSPRFRHLLGRLRREFQPHDMMETSLIESMAVAHWRHMRIWGAQKAGIARAVESSAATLSGEDPAASVATALNQPLFGSLARDESRLDRQFQSAIRTLLQLRKMRMQTQPKPEKSIS